MKRLFRKFHLWVSEPFGIIIALVCFSGAMLVFEQEVMQLSRPDFYYVDRVGERTLPADELVRRAQTALPADVEVKGLTISADPGRTWQVNLSKPRRAWMAIDPYTGEVKGIYERAPFFNTMFRLHRWLLDSASPDGGVFWGKVIVGTSVLLFVIVLITGVVIWWPRTRAALRNGLKVSVTRGWRRFWYDLHVAGGMYALVFLLAMALTGLTWSFQWYRTGFYAVFGIEAQQGGGHGPGGPEAGRGDKARGGRPMADASADSGARGDRHEGGENGKSRGERPAAPAVAGAKNDAESPATPSRKKDRGDRPVEGTTSASQPVAGDSTTGHRGRHHGNRPVEAISSASQPAASDSATGHRGRRHDARPVEATSSASQSAAGDSATGKREGRRGKRSAAASAGVKATSQRTSAVDRTGKKHGTRPVEGTTSASRPGQVRGDRHGRPGLDATGTDAPETTDFTQWQKVYEQLALRNPGYRQIGLSDGSATVAFDALGNSRASDRYTFDPATGRITDVELYADSKAASKMRGWIYAVHVGSWGGMATRILTFLAALLGASLPLTGYYLWIKRLMRRRKGK